MKRTVLGLAVAVALLAPAPGGHAAPLLDELTLAPQLVPGRSLPVPADLDSRLAAGVLGRTNRYALGTWWARWMTDLEPYWSAQRTLAGEDVRRFASVSYSLAVSLYTGSYDATLTGVPAATATDRAVQIVQFLVRTHRANSPKGWGRSWQSSFWAGIGGHAGWLLGDALPQADALLLARMLADEADDVASRAPKYYRDRTGKILHAGDSGAEEVAWEALELFVATELLPLHSHRERWATEAYRRMVAAYARPADVTSSQVVNGTAVRSWLGGSNAEPSGFVVNHKLLHPDYTACVSENLVAATVAPLVGDGVPEAARFNASVVYGALQKVRFAAPPFRAPGGTSYVRGSAKIYYPQGTLWGTDRYILYSTLDAQAGVLGLDAGLPVPARNWERLHIDAVRRMQARSRTGQTYVEGDSDRYALREEQAALYAGWAYLTRWVALNKLVRWTNDPPSTKRVA